MTSFFQWHSSLWRRRRKKKLWRL